MATRKDRSKTAQPGRGKYGFTGDDPEAQKLDMFALDGELLRDALAHIVLEGDAVLIGLTSDQGALCIRVMSDAGKEVFYPTSTQSVERLLMRFRDLQG